MDRENCPRAFDAVVELDLESVLKSDELAEFLVFPSNGWISMGIP